MLLAANPAWQAMAEAAAGALLAIADRDAVAAEFGAGLRGLDHDLIGARAGYQPGHGYVEPTQAAADILAEQVEPYLQDMSRRHRLGLTGAAAQIGAGVLLGLYACREVHDEQTVLAWVEDFPNDHAWWVAQQLRKMDLLTAPLAEELAGLMPDWAWINSPTA